MEANSRWAPVTAVAPVAWGSTYFVTHEYLPADHPLWGAAIRALPAGLLLLALRRRLPRGRWWGRSAVLGVLNVGAFFVLVYLAAQLLPTSAAATIMALSPVPMMLLGWVLLAQRPAGWHLLGAGVGIPGVGLMLLTGDTAVDGRGVLASVAALVLSSLGYLLATRWAGQVDVLASTSWQLVAGGLLLVPVALAVEGPPPALDGRAVLAFGYVGLVATAAAFVAWFAGLRRLPAGTVGLLGLLNPVTGVLLGTAVAAEPLSARQLGGLALVLAGVLLGQPAVTARLARWRPSGIEPARRPVPVAPRASSAARSPAKCRRVRLALERVAPRASSAASSPASSPASCSRGAGSNPSRMAAGCGPAR